MENLEVKFKLDHYSKVAEIVPIKDNHVYCPFCGAELILRGAYTSGAGYDVGFFNGSCKCKAMLYISATSDEGIYSISYFLFEGDHYYKIQHNFSQGRVHVRKSSNRYLGPSHKEITADFPIDKIDFLFDNFDQVETYLLFS